MKKQFNLKVMAASVLLGSTMFGTAQADSLLVPLIISDTASGFETIIDVKVRGNGINNSRWSDVSDLHYSYLRKGNSVAALFDKTAGCAHENGNGRVSSWDMNTHTIDPAFDILAKPVASDASTAFTPAGPFVGMAVLTDTAARIANQEGDMSGFAYVMDYNTGMMLDYKLLNNHKSTQEGNFNSGFVRKTSVDLAWNPLLRDVTAWLAVATGPLMATQSGGWNGTVKISQDTNVALANSSPKNVHNDASNRTGGVYNNDEENFSGDKPVEIKCMGLFVRDDFLRPTQELNTRMGGWTRRSIIGTDGAGGGMVYKLALKVLPSGATGSAQVSFQSETSGHLAAGNEHANRPY